MRLTIINNGAKMTDKDKPQPRAAEVGRRYTFEACHSLPHLPPSHRCSNMHGHRYIVWVYVKGPIDPRMGWVQEYSEIDAAVDKWIDLLDHGNVNRLVDVSTAENLAGYLWDKLAADLPMMTRVEVHETERAVVTMTREDAGL